VTVNTNKVVGGVTPACLDVASTFYQQTIGEIVPVSSPQVAEMSKVFENTFRAVNIALVNEMAQLCDKMGVDVWEVLDAAATKPFSADAVFGAPASAPHHWIALPRVSAALISTCASLRRRRISPRPVRAEKVRREI
jgi:UDP-N-acetyl-D-glucosamine dehydrogenase